MTYMVGYSNPPKQLTIEQLAKRTDWFMVHPEVRTRLLALMDASKGTVGFGGGWRSEEAEAAEFVKRHVRVDHVTALFYDGSYWELRPGFAALAPPGLSYHESTLDGFALAADLTGDIAWSNAHCHEFALRTFANLAKPEAWHHQPVEIPNSRRAYEADPSKYPLKSWSPLAPPVPVTEPATHPTEDVRMLVVVSCKNDPVNPNRRWLWNGVSIRLMKDEAEFNRARMIWPFHPNWSTLAKPFEMELHEIEEFTA